MGELVLFITGFLTLMYFSYTAGKNKEQLKSGEVFIDAVKKAKDAKHKLADPEYRRMLWAKYKK